MDIGRPKKIRDADLIGVVRLKRASQCPKCNSYAFHNGRCFDCIPWENPKNNRKIK